MKSDSPRPHPYPPPPAPACNMIAINNSLWFGLKIFCAFCQPIHICIISYLKNFHKRDHAMNAVLHLSVSICMSRIFHINTHSSAHFKMTVPYFSTVEFFLTNLLLMDTSVVYSFCSYAKHDREHLTHFDKVLWVHPIGNIPVCGISVSKCMLVPFKVL